MRRNLPLVAVIVLGAATPAAAQCFETDGTVALQAQTPTADIDGAVVNLVDVPEVTPPSGSAQAASSADAPLSGAGSLGSGGGELLLFAAIGAAVVLPVVVYIIDGEADGPTLRRYRCFSFSVQGIGGAVSTPSRPNVFTPVVGGKLTMGAGLFGLDTSMETTVDGASFGAWDVHLQLRVPPKQHIDGALAVGFRRVVFGGAEHNGVEVALPHRYILTRGAGSSILGLELMPAVLVGPRGVDGRLEAAFVVPIGPMALKLGGRVFSFDRHVRGGGVLTLSAGF